jgi:thiol-disulfide isomerase/thioredoxin
MKGLRSIVAGSIIISIAMAFASETPKADAVLQKALAQAKQEHKNVLVDFRASWCPWCVRLEHLYEDPKFGPKFKESFVFAPITVRERAARRVEENAGWESIMLGFRKDPAQDIPYVVILNPQGKAVADSFERKGERIPGNAGFPQSDEEIAAYLDTLHKTAPAFSEADLAELKAYFLNVRAKRQGH